MSRLILFSGGVESTALMTMATPDDIALVIRPTDVKDVQAALTYKQSSIDAISKFFNISVHYGEYVLPRIQTKTSHVHQMKMFIGMVHLMVSRYPSIVEVWCGRNCDEPNPNVPFLHPLDHLSKVEQMVLIPKEIRHHISSCVTHNNCGYCFKCKEYT
jgi:hypothetical protein